MHKYKCVIAYDGSHYSGFQIQPNAQTIQGLIEKALSTMHKTEKRITASGRTDAGVHAKGQVFHFESELNIDEQRWTKALNTQLPTDIRVLSTEKVSTDFHARYDSTGKEYRYYVDTGQVQSPFHRLYAYHVPGQLDVEAMNRAAEHLCGRHDFTSFSSAKTAVENKERTIHICEWQATEDYYVLSVVGNGFLYNMVRIIAGTLIEVGKGKRDVVSISKLIQEKNRKQAGPTAPAHGLYLWQVFY